MVGISYFNHAKRKVSKISAGGRLRKNNQALSYLSYCCPNTLKNCTRLRAHILATFSY